MDPLFVQALGFAAYAINMVGFSTSRDQLFRGLLFCSCTLFSLHYALLGAYVASANLGVNGLRSIASLRYKGGRAFIIFAIVQCALGTYFFRGALDLLPWSASLLSGYALFCQSGIKMRISMLTCALIWMINAIIVGSWGASLNDITNATLIAITIYRMSKTTAGAAPAPLPDEMAAAKRNCHP